MFRSADVTALPDPGLFGPGSVAWRVMANPVALAVGGVAAVILELAEPRVRTGVWEHSTFRTRPLERMRRTAASAMITTYGTTAEAMARIAMVNRMHERVRGTTPEGLAYEALDPALLTWVHLTAGWGFRSAYVRFVEPGMSAADQDRYHAEGSGVGRAFGAVGAPTSVAEVEAQIAAMRPNLRPHPIIHEFLGLVGKALVGPLAGVSPPLLTQAAIDLLPEGLAEQLELPVKPWAVAAGRPLIAASARVAKLAPRREVREARRRVGDFR